MQIVNQSHNTISPEFYHAIISAGTALGSNGVRITDNVVWFAFESTTYKGAGIPVAYSLFAHYDYEPAPIVRSVVEDLLQCRERLIKMEQENVA